MTIPEDPAARLRLLIADELERSRGEMEALGVALCADPALVAAHGGALQALDRLGQQQLALATLLRADDPIGALQAITLGDLQRRLHLAMAD
ncbi:hypothetical protein GGQ80_003376 [Sphingomonas jinjuensis]|uniref:Uncharacterized protein n=1 Tax=Sphingomonas jinjuensis TaxID=535907 RepID=A0A840F894_9SPHN|nr:hypothetical protein [Sphingomonas jinjuensis]